MTLLHDRASKHIRQGGAIFIKSYTRPVIVKHLERIRPGKQGEPGLYVATDRYARQWDYVLPMHVAFI